MATKLSTPLLLTLFLYVLFINIQVISGARKPKIDHSAGQNCTNHVEIIDKCSSSATYSYTAKSNQFPLNQTDMKVSCERIAEGVKCLKIYGKCLVPLAKRALSTYATTRSKHSRKLCANLNDAKAIEFYKSNECIKSKNKSDVMIADERELISTIQLLASSTEMKFEERLHQACCAANAYRIKVMADVAPECLKFMNAYEDMLQSMVGELLESACPDSDRLKEICPKLPKLVLAKDWKPTSLTSAALNLIISLSQDRKD